MVNRALAFGPIVRLYNEGVIPQQRTSSWNLECKEGKREKEEIGFQ